VLFEMATLGIYERQDPKTDERTRGKNTQCGEEDAARVNPSEEDAACVNPSEKDAASSKKKHNAEKTRMVLVGHCEEIWTRIRSERQLKQENFAKARLAKARLAKARLVPSRCVPSRCVPSRCVPSR
jgi:hypothetical protein